METVKDLDATLITNLLPARLTSVVTRGFGRGSKDLGIPTANICRKHLQCSISFDELPCGIYWGYARIIHTMKDQDQDEEEVSRSLSSLPSVDRLYKTAVSVGYNPVYGNKEKTIEPHLIASSDHPMRQSSICQETQFSDFYNDRIRLSIVGYLRPELPFEGIDKLIDAIKQDIVQTERLADESGHQTTHEKQWGGSDHDFL